MAPSGSQALLFDVHFDCVFFFSSLSYEHGLTLHLRVTNDNRLDFASLSEHLRERSQQNLYVMYYVLLECDLEKGENCNASVHKAVDSGKDKGIMMEDTNILPNKVDKGKGILMEDTTVVPNWKAGRRNNEVDSESEYSDKFVDFLSEAKEELIELRKRKSNAKKTPTPDGDDGTTNLFQIFETKNEEYPIHDEDTHWKIRKPKVGERLVDVEQLKECLTYYGLANGFSLWFYRTSKNQVIARCGLRPAKLKEPDKGKQSKWKRYPSARDDKSNYPWRWIGKHFGQEIRQNPLIKPHEIADLEMKNYKCIVSPTQCRNAKKLTLNKGETTTEKHYAMIKSYGKEFSNILDSNEGSTVKLGVIVNPDDKTYFDRSYCYFICLNAGWKLGEDIGMESRNGLTLMFDQHKCARHIYEGFRKQYSGVELWHVIPAGGNNFKVRNGSKAFGVNEQDRSCTCRMWQLSGLPCLHAIAVMFRGGAVRGRGDAVRGGRGRCGVVRGRGGAVRGGRGSGEGIETSRATIVGSVDTIRCEPVRGATSGGLSNLGGKRKLFEADAGTSKPGKTLWLRIRRGIGKRNVVAKNVRYNRLGRWFGINESNPTPSEDNAEGSVRQADNVMQETSLNEQAARMDLQNLQKSNSTNKLHEKDSKSDLSVIRDKFLHSEELKPSNYDGRHKRLKRLNDRKLKIQECKVQEVTTPNASSGDTDSGGFISDNGNAHSSENDCNKTGNAQSSEKQSSTYGNESSRSRNECTERSNSRDDTDIRPSYDT
ncbi:pentatricopeptide repeat-containing protein [Tanacetum coccineum]|uniref:Pentatricopeptide repeat-containing protein n=1 Tax=Tanacetum coccineum TaxID=301880 RepID=A0ABQ5HC44_9ASTR